MMVTKYLFILFAILYFGIIEAWCFRYPLSYGIVGSKPNIIEERSLTNEEYKAEQKTIRVREWISLILLFASVVVFVVSFFYLRNIGFEPALLAKLVMIVSGIVILILLLVKGIHFIPGPPIR